jgi:hypothetical protein
VVVEELFQEAIFAAMSHLQTVRAELAGTRERCDWPKHSALLAILNKSQVVGESFGQRLL